MDHYVDIDLRPDPEFVPHHLMSALYAKLHRALVGLGCNDIGVSFPRYDASAPHLGSRLRLHGKKDALLALMDTEWLTGMRDHAAVAPPSAVPVGVQHRAVRRVQAKSNPERLRRRLLRRHDISEEEAMHRIPDSAARLLWLPFVQLKSSSTGQAFRFFIDQSAAQPLADEGSFSAYGLSQDATVPWF